jgi:transposase-like protein
MKKTRRCYDSIFKISVVSEIEASKPLAQIAPEHGIHPSLPSRWRDELAENPERAFRGKGLSGRIVAPSTIAAWLRWIEIIVIREL